MSNYKQHNDNIQEENEHSQLVQDLHSLYDTHSADTQSLARIRSRLLQRASIPLPDKEDDNIITFQSLDTAEKHDNEITSTTTRRLNEWRNARRHWPRLVSEIAALIIVFALLGSIVLVFSLRPHAPAHNEPLPTNPNGQIQQIHLIDAKVGWAVVQTKHGSNVDPNSAIMRTTDGGHTWYDVTPPESLNQWSTGVEVSQAPITDFLSANTAWIALVPVTTGDRASLYFTKDGGKTWQESSIPVNNIKQMSFIDAQHGWVLTELPPVSTLDNADVESVALFQTMNGGETWAKVSQSSFDRQLNDTTTGSLPASGIKAGFTFIDTQIGWIVGQTQHANFFWFYITHDGGRTWQHQDLPHPIIPTSTTSSTGAEPQFQLQPPMFFGNEGVLAFTVPTNGKYASSSNTANNETLEIYFTHDGGNSWQSTPSPLSTNGIRSGIFSDVQFVDSSHGYVSMNNQIFFVHRNTNSNSWTVTSTTIHGEVLQLSFVSPSTGWLLVNGVLPNSSRVNPDDQWLLYQTTDGGKSWTQINYSTMGQRVQTSQKLNAGWTPVANYSGTGSKIMYLRGQITPSKQWWLVYSCLGTGSLSFYSPELHFAGDIPSCSTTPLASNSGSGGTIQQNALTPISIQVQAFNATKWNVLVVECTNSQRCKGSPIG